MKFLKISLIALGAIVFVLVIVAVIFVATFDSAQYKNIISEQVKQRTGRELTLGQIQPSVFPWLGVELRDVTLSNAEGFNADYMIQMQRMDVRLKLLPLLSQKIHIDTLRAHGFELYLEKSKNGRTNWDDLQQDQAVTVVSSTQSTPEKNKQNGVSNVDPLAGLLVNGIELSNAKINWNDASTGKQISLQNINLTTGELRTGEALPIKLSSVLELSEPKAQLAFELTTRLEFNLAEQQFKLANLMLILDAQLTQSKISFKLKSELNMDVKRQRFDLRDYVIEINAQGEDVPGGQQQIFIEGAVVVDLKKQTAKIKPLNLQTQELEINIETVIKDFLGEPVAAGSLAIETFDPRALAKLWDFTLPETQNKSVLTKASVGFYFVVNSKELDVSSLMLRLDKSTFLAQAQVKNFDSPQVVYSVKLDQMVVDDYLPPPAAKLAKKSSNSILAVQSKSNVSQDVPIDLPVTMLRSLNVNGVFQGATLIVADQFVADLNIKLKAKSGVINISELSAKVLKGDVIASAQLDVRKSIPQYRFKLQGKQLKAESIINPVLQNLLGEKSVKMSGRSDVNVNIKAQGETLNQLIASSHGAFNLNMGEAKLHGVDAEYFVRKGVISFLEKKKQTVPQDWRGEYKPKETTALKVARASATIRSGVVENKDLLLEASRFKVTGAGKIFLPKEKLDYRVVVDVQPAKTKTAGERLLDVPMPIFVKGSFAQPNISIDSKVWLKSVGKELKSEVKAEIKKKLKKEKKKKVDELKNKYKDKFKGFFK